MTRTLITGAAGFTGRYLTKLLAARGHEVHGLVYQPPALPVAELTKVHVGDLVDPSVSAQVVAAVRPDHVVHLAAISHVAHGDIDEMYRSNIVGTRHLLQALAHSDHLPQSVLLASSANVYGNALIEVIDEQSPMLPANDYGVTKVAMEFVASIFRPSLPIIVVRPFNYTGVGQSADFLIPKIISHARNAKAEIELGNLEVARDFSDVRTVVEAYARLLADPTAIGETFNVSSGQAVSLKSLIDMVARISGHSMKVRVNPAFLRANELRTLCGSPVKLHKSIGPLPHIPLEETLRWMLTAL